MNFPTFLYIATSRCCAAFMALLKAIHAIHPNFKCRGNPGMSIFRCYVSSWILKGNWGVSVCFFWGNRKMFQQKIAKEPLFWMVRRQASLNFFFFSYNLMGCFINQLLPLWPKVWDLTIFCILKFMWVANAFWATCIYHLHPWEGTMLKRKFYLPTIDF